MPVCKTCLGKRVLRVVCNNCGGRGTVWDKKTFSDVRCQTCKGLRRIDRRCPTCRGSGRAK